MNIKWLILLTTALAQKVCHSHADCPGSACIFKDAQSGTCESSTNTTVTTPACSFNITLQGANGGCPSGQFCISQKCTTLSDEAQTFFTPTVIH